MSLQVIYPQYLYQKVLWEVFPQSPFPVPAALALAQVTDVTLLSVLPVPSLTLSYPSSISSDRHWHEKGMCSGVNESECLARDAFKRGQTFRGRREQFLCKGWAPTEQRVRDMQALLATLGSVCAAQLTQLGPVYNYERVFFPWFVGWLFYFQIT